MHKLRSLFFISAIVALPLFAQFMDPEKPLRGDTQTTNNDEFFPQIIPNHSWGGEEVVVIEKEIGVISNTVEKTVEQVVVMSNTVERVVEQVTVVSNTVEKVVEQVTIVSNVIEQVAGQVDELSNDVAVVQEKKLDNDTESLTNSTEFVQAVQAVTPTSTNVWPKLEFDRVKEENAKFKEAFTSITGMTISAEITINEIKRNLQIIKDAATSVLAE